MAAGVPAVRQAPSVALAASADTPQGNKDQHVVFVAAPPPRRKRFSLNIFSFLKSKTQPDSAPDLSTIMCCHCHATGLHFSHDCPLSCEVCGERGHKDPLECTPQCTACGGGGKIMRRSPGDDPLPIVRLLYAQLEGVHEAMGLVQKRLDECIAKDVRMLEDVRSTASSQATTVLIKRATKIRDCTEALQLQAYHAARCGALLAEVLAIHDMA